MGSPVSGRGCVLPQSAIVTKTIYLTGGIGSGPSRWGPPSQVRAVFLQPAIVTKAIPPSGGIGSGPSRWGHPSQGQMCVGGFPHLIGNEGLSYASPVYSFGMRSPFGSSVSFRHS